MAWIKRENLIKGLSQIAHFLDDENEIFISIRDMKRLIEQIQEEDAMQVIKCKDCAFCFELGDLSTPYRHRDGVSGFSCTALDMDFYTPIYCADEFYCASAEKRRSEKEVDDGGSIYYE